MKTFLLSLLSLILMTNCSDVKNSESKPAQLESTHYKNFYFPVDQFKKTKVYHYTPDKDDAPNLYLVFSRSEKDGKIFFNTRSFTLDNEGNLKNVEMLSEEINETGAFTKQYTEFQKDEDGNEYEVAARLENECVFKWNIAAGESFTWNFETDSNIYPGYVVKTKRERKFTGKQTEIEFKGKKYDALVFADTFEVQFVNSAINDKDQFGFSQKSYYADGIGMYQYVRDLQDTQLTFTLTDILSLEEWEEIKNNI